MPEGDSIWQTAAKLNEALAGKVLTASDFRVPGFATLDLSGWTVRDVAPRGKHLLIRLEPVPALANGPHPNGPSGRKLLTIHSHLKMEGSWQVYPPGGRWRKPGHTARCVLRTSDADVVGFSLGTLEVILTSEEDKVLGYLGPDILGPDWDPHPAAARILAAPDIPIGVALLDQRNVAGIGNIYRCEACFTTGLHPAVPVSEVPDVPLLLDDARRMLQANLAPGRRATVGVELAPATARPGTEPQDGRRSTVLAVSRSIRRDAGSGFRRQDAFRNGRARPPAQDAGRGTYWVYGREGRSCLLCGTPIRRGVLGPTSGMEDRDIFFCPVCQPAP